MPTLDVPVLLVTAQLFSSSSKIPTSLFTHLGSQLECHHLGEHVEGGFAATVERVCLQRPLTGLTGDVHNDPSSVMLHHVPRCTLGHVETTFTGNKQDKDENMGGGNFVVRNFVVLANPEISSSENSSSEISSY